jgi:class 3 adenylate cyclase
MVDMLMKGDVDTKLGGRKYEGTVFFSDIIGFTRMSENLSADQVVSNLNRYFNIMQKIIYDNGGNVDKFGGDAIMAFWGVPEHDDNDELNAVLTGIEMQSNLWSFNLALEREGMELIHMGIGINTGVFVAGNVGSEDKIEFTLIGDEVNLASRIESHAGRGQVFVAESTWNRIMHKASGVKLPPVRVKGKSKPVQIYSVRSILNSSSSYFSSAIYCEVLNASGNMLGKGVIVAVGDVDNDPYMVLNCNCPLEVNQQLGLRMSVAELGTPMGMVAHVKSAGNMILSGHKVGYSRVVLNRLSEGGGLEIFRPGNWMDSTLSWDMLKRV